ncbi:hypothetical protein PAESOLCIP111_06388 [Paenibacillus solanacearum]|uniref:CBM6 domain-containing protein n=1 Tax=Paenibacillus solanacearum TaxID=2048548 RepID=A0A916K7V0_9BACL|nr:family 43 glycosylhydrolase [Paenibacillus solanacearum]CAG7651777.1 hypothetical protein PAESOLCIP111_06388 [Paenibacillus solanacearum]
MSKKLMTIVLAFCMTFGFGTSVLGYSNPFSFTDSWNWNNGNFYGEGDPYILKFNGTYYLYVSTVDDKAGVKVWSSTDLVNWTYRGLCAVDAITKAAYAPEVVYWNGYFYMYTSPGGNGHYVLRSESPLGPFTVQTGNKGLGIDGHVFIDDDGKWYFYRTGSNNITVNPMSDPYTFGAGSNTGANMNGWTEGATVFKRNGKYYMTYTGNHVWNNAYRVDYAFGSSPTTGFAKQTKQNPILINSEGPNDGLGHNGVVVGPDLDTHYIVYHSHAEPGRRFNMDRIVWNKDQMIVLGPTTTDQPNPDQPLFSDRFERSSIGTGWTNVNGGTWGIFNQELMWQNTIGNATWYRQITTGSTAGSYTAEFNMKQMKQGTSAAPRYGAVFSYIDENNFGHAVLNRNTNSLETQFRVNGVDQGILSSVLPSGYDYTKWHTIRIEKVDSTYKVYVDGMLKQTRDNITLGGGKVGYTTSDAHADFGYVAYSNKVNGSNAWYAAMPVPGTVEAVHYMTGSEGMAYHDTTSENIGGEYRNTAVDIRSSAAEVKYVVGWNQTGEWLKYRVNVASTDTYDVDLRVATNLNGAQVRIWDGSTDLTGVRNVPNTGGWENWQTVTLKGLSLTAGIRELRVEIVTGEFDFAGMKFHQAASVSNVFDDFNDGNDNGWVRFEGNWVVENGELSSEGGIFGKTTIGNEQWADYTVESDIKLIETTGDAGILVRVNNPANGKHLVDNPDYLQGYYAHIKTNGVYLGKFNYGWTSLTNSAMSIPANTWQHMKVVVSGANIKVYVGDMATPKINYTDTSSNPFTHGKVGLRSMYNHTHFDNFKVSP